MHDVAKSISNVPVQSNARPRRRWRSVVIAIGLLVAIVVFVFGIKALQIRKMMTTPMVMPPTTVSSATVKEEDWAPTLSAVGSISAVQGAVVSSELGGVVSQIAFENGGTAKKGDLLVQLDASAEEALLRSAEAEAELGRQDLERTRGLASQKVVSKAELDAAESKFNRLNAVVDQMRSNIRKKTIIAPFDGQLGIRQVNVGQMINPGQQVVQLTTWTRSSPISPCRSNTLPQLATGYETDVHADGLPGREFKGNVTAINSMVDAVTRNVSVQATLENPDHALHPGMFVKVDVVLPQKSKTLVIPGSAVSYAPYGNSVFVIEHKKDPKTGKESQSLRQAFVRIGEARGDFVAVTEGLKPGDAIVSTGVFKLRNGMPVVINNDLAPKPQLNPKPQDS